MAFSWQGIEVKAGGTAKRSALVRFGTFETSHITLTLLFPDLTESVLPGLPVSITGTVTASVSPTAPDVRLFLSIDGADVSGTIELPGPFVLIAPFSLPFVPETYGLASGTHTLSFFAVDADGDVSQPQTATLTVSDGPAPDVPVPTDATEQKGDRTVVAIIGAIGGSGLIGGIMFALLYFGRRKDWQSGLFISATASGTAGLKPYMVDELLPG
jgi:hypothetical protein